MPANTLFIDRVGRAHVLVVPPPPRPGQHPWREPPFVIQTLGLSVGGVIYTDDRRHGPHLRSLGNIWGKVLAYIDLETLAADLDARVVETRDKFGAAVGDAKARYEEERSRRLAAATIASTTHRSASAFASA